MGRNKGNGVHRGFSMGCEVLTNTDHFTWTDVRAGAGSGDQSRRVVPFPRGGRGGVVHGDGLWTFTTDIQWVEGAEGNWLRDELAAVTRDLLVWAREDKANSVREHPGERRAA